MKSLLALAILRVRNSWNSLFTSLLLVPLLLISATAVPARAQIESTQEAEGIQTRPSTLLDQLRDGLEVETESDFESDSESDPSAEITDIRLVEIEDGLKVVLVTDQPELVEFFQFQEGTTLTVDITNATLFLADSVEGFLADDGSYQQLNPIPGVASLRVEQRGSEIQLTVISDRETPPVAYFERLSEALQLDVVTLIPGATDTEIDFGSNNLRIIVTAAPLDGYRVPNSSVGTRTDTAIIDVPQSIQVIPEQVLEDQNVQTLNEALRNASGVSSGRALSGARSATPLIRGFENNNNILRNGLRDDTLQFGSALPNVERIEILKGPASVLFGAGDLGGTINIVTETPLYDPQYEFEANAGSFNELGGLIDFGGPLGDSNDQLAYRLNVAYLTEGSFIDFVDSDFFFVAPSLQVVNTDRSSLIIDLEYQRSRTRNSSLGLPAFAAIGLEDNELIETIESGETFQGFSQEELDFAGNIDFSTNLGEPGEFARSRVQISRLGYRLNHEFDDSWQINHEFLGSFQETPEEVFVGGLQTAQVNGATDLTKVQRIVLSNPSNRDFYLFNTNVIGEFDIFGIEQTLLLGSELSFEREEDLVFFTFESGPAFDLINPVYGDDVRFGVIIDEVSDIEDFRPTNNTVANRNRYSFYGQSQLDFFSGDLIALIGGRMDIVDQDFQDFANVSNPEPILINETAISPRVGLVYKPLDNVSLFVSYATSFNPEAGRTADGKPFEPERGRQYEAGIKASFFNDRVSAGLAYYDLSRTNVATNDPDNPGSQLQIGEQKSSGIEFDIAGELLPGWNIIANYANTNARIVSDEDPNIDVGTQLINAPFNSANLWTTYQLQQGPLEGLGVGLGVSFVGDRNGELRRPFELPSYTRTDASIFYRKNSFRTQVNFENLFNVRYIEGARDQFRVQPGAPFSVSASIGWEF